MPIDGISDIRRLPRVGKIRLGIKKISPRTSGPYPVATDYFVCPEEVTEELGEFPKTLPIMFPSENPEEFAQQWLRCYSMTQGLICKGDGKTCLRKTDLATGALADHNTEEWEFRTGRCDPDNCPENIGDPKEGIKPQCRRVMNLIFLLPDVPGVGVWQLDTSSLFSIININSCVDLIKSLCGRISFIPLTLSLEPREVVPPGVKKKTVHILYVRSEVKLVEIQRYGELPPSKVLLPFVEEEEPPADLFPPETLAKAEVSKEEPPAEEVEGVPTPLGVATPEDVTPEDIPDINALYRLCHHFWKIQPQEIYKELGFKNAASAGGINSWTAWLQIKAVKQGPQDSS